MTNDMLEKPAKTNLRKLQWTELVEYFYALPTKHDFAAKDLVDYFHFKYLENTNVRIWTTPDYVKQKALANKVLSIYGVDYSIRLIDTLFDNYYYLLGRKYTEIKWSLGLISSDKMGWLMEKLFIACNRYKPNKINALLQKPRNEWSDEERAFFNSYIKGETNGT